MNPGGDADPEIEVAAGLIFRDGRLLVAQRRRGDHLGGCWEFPGGKRMSHETFEECLRRELKEELDVEVEVGELVETVRYVYPGRRILLKFYRCRLGAGEPRSVGCDALAWIRAEELDDYVFPAADAVLVDRLRCSPAWWDSERGPGQTPP
jgi:mutator protein MutT